MKLWSLILGGLLAGCVTPHLGLVSPLPMPPAVNQRAAFPLDAATSIQTPPMTHLLLSWENNNIGDSNVVTGLQITTDFITWQTICETNCDEATNFFTVPMEQVGFIRAFNRFK